MSEVLLHLEKFSSKCHVPKPATVQPPPKPLNHGSRYEFSLRARIGELLRPPGYPSGRPPRTTLGSRGLRLQREVFQRISETAHLSAIATAAANSDLGTGPKSLFDGMSSTFDDNLVLLFTDELELDDVEVAGGGDRISASSSLSTSSIVAPWVQAQAIAAELRNTLFPTIPTEGPKTTATPTQKRMCTQQA